MRYRCFIFIARNNTALYLSFISGETTPLIFPDRFWSITDHESKQFGTRGCGGGGRGWFSSSSRLIIMISLREFYYKLVSHRAIAILVTRPHRHRRHHRHHIIFLQMYYYCRDEPLENDRPSIHHFGVVGRGRDCGL